MIDYDIVLNDRVKHIRPSGIRKFFDISNDMKDVISLSIGEPDFKTPWHIRQAGVKSIEEGNTWYSPNKGFCELIEEIGNYFFRKFNVEYKNEEILVTVGGSEAIDLAIRTLVNYGDEVLITQPSFVCYEPMITMVGGIPIIIETRQENKFRLTAKDLEQKITSKTKLIILSYPNNPTGAVMRKQDLEQIAKVIKKHDLMVISDEIYAELTYGEGRHICFSEIEGMKERTIIVSGFSKSYAMTGWRLGYALGPSLIIYNMTKLHQYSIMSAPTVAQYAAIEALKNGDNDIEIMRSKYDVRRRMVVSRLREMGLECFKPEGAFYVFPSIKRIGISSEEFCKGLIYKERVAVIPGSAFGECGEGFVRISYSYSLKHIEEALKRIERFLNGIEY